MSQDNSLKNLDRLVAEKLDRHLKDRLAVLLSTILSETDEVRMRHAQGQAIEVRHLIHAIATDEEQPKSLPDVIASLAGY